MATAPTHIDDLGDPRVPWWLRIFNAVGGPVAKRRFRFDAEELLARAQQETGLSNFGPDDFREPFGLLVEDLAKDVPLSTFGRFTAYTLVLGQLKTRLRLEAMIDDDPSILEQEIARPIIIAGLPRTGTTHLFNLISQHPRLRSLPYWESLEPLPGEKDPPPETRAPGAPDPRIARCQQGVDFMNRVMPLFPAMHEFEPEVPHEEVQLQMMNFSTQLYEASYQSPRYCKWIESTDQTPSYAYLKRVLKVLQHLRGGRRWILKSPQHLENLRPLAATFPDAYVVQTHRDPVRIVASLATMTAYGKRMQMAEVDPHAVGSHWARRIGNWLDISIEHRSAFPSERVFDVHFQEFMKDDVAMVERLLEWAGEPQDDASREAIRAFAARNVRGKHGAIAYPLDDLGLDRETLRASFRHYQEHFGVPSES